MGVLLGLGDAQLLQAGGGDQLAQGLAELLRRKQRRDERPQGFGIVGEAERGGEAHEARPREAGKAGVEQRRQRLADAVGAEVAHQQAVAVAHPGIVADRGRPHELVILAPPIGGFDRRQRV